MILLAIKQAMGLVICSKNDKEDAHKFLFTHRLDDFIEFWHLPIEANYIRKKAFEMSGESITCRIIRKRGKF